MSERHWARMSAATATSVSSSHSRARVSKKSPASILERPASLVRRWTMAMNSSSVCWRWDCSICHWCSARRASAPTRPPRTLSRRHVCAALRKETRPPRKRTPSCARKRDSSVCTASFSRRMASRSASSEGTCVEPSASSKPRTGARCFRSSGTTTLSRRSSSLWSLRPAAARTPTCPGRRWSATARCAVYSARRPGARTSRKSRATRAGSQAVSGSSASSAVAGSSSSTCRASSPWRCCRSTWLKTRQTSSACWRLDLAVRSKRARHLSSKADHSLAKMRRACSSAMACEAWACQSSSMVFLKWTFRARSWSRSTASVRLRVQV
mmetsp:Transcript_95821/g.309378  ORF Transcript_95821/g.309378 Transcript_95821/m.309378 type:complete len:325 (+) Transcript_95821:1021-1995(+)